MPTTARHPGGGTARPRDGRGGHRRGTLTGAATGDVRPTRRGPVVRVGCAAPGGRPGPEGGCSIARATAAAVAPGTTPGGPPVGGETGPRGGVVRLGLRRRRGRNCPVCTTKAASGALNAVRTVPSRARPRHLRRAATEATSSGRAAHRGAVPLGFRRNRKGRAKVDTGLGWRPGRVTTRCAVGVVATQARAARSGSGGHCTRPTTRRGSCCHPARSAPPLTTLVAPRGPRVGVCPGVVARPPDGAPARSTG